MAHDEIITLIKELKKQIGLLKESLTILTAKHYADSDAKKNQVQTKRKFNPNNNKPQASILSLPTSKIPTKQVDNEEKQPLTPKRIISLEAGN